MSNSTMSKMDILLSLLMPVLLIMMTLTHSAVYLYVVIGISLLRIKKPLVIFPVYFVASLSTEWFGLGTGASSGRFLSIIMILSLLVEMKEKGNYSKFNNKTFLLLLFLVYCFISSLLSVTGSFDAFFLILQGILILLLFSIRINDDVDVLKFLLFYTAIIVLVGVLVVILTIGLAEFTIARMGQMDEIETNSNRIAMMMAQICSIFMACFSYEGFKGVISLLLYIVSLFVVFLTGSRTGLLACIIPFLILYFMIHRVKIIYFVLSTIVLVAVFYFVFYLIDEQNYTVMDRMSIDEIIYSGGSDRLPAIKLMWQQIFPQYPMFGVGLGGANFNAVALRYGMDHPCHNIFFDSLCQLGIVGFVIFFFIPFDIFNTTYRSIKRYKNELCIIGLSTLLTATLNGIGETVYLEKLFWNTMVLCVIGNGFAKSNSHVQDL